MNKMINKKYACLLFGEGKKDKNFVYALTELEKFKYHTENWRFRYGNAHGGSADDVIELCKKEKTGEEDAILCFIDLDDLKNDYPRNWKQKKGALEKESLIWNGHIIWQIDNAEDEYKKVLGDGYKNKSKDKINKAAKENIEKFINSDLWKRILMPIKECEKKLKVSK